METIKNAFKSGYFQFVSFIRDMPTIWFGILWAVLVSLTLVCIMKFFKKYDGTQKEFVKVSLIILAVIFFAFLMFITYVR